MSLLRHDLTSPTFQMVFQFNKTLFKLVITELETVSLDSLKDGEKRKPAKKVEIGLLLPDAAVCFNKAEG